VADSRRYVRSTCASIGPARRPLPDCVGGMDLPGPHSLQDNLVRRVITVLCVPKDWLQRPTRRLALAHGVTEEVVQP
jgi:hypothetical protein